MPQVKPADAASAVSSSGLWGQRSVAHDGAPALAQVTSQSVDAVPRNHARATVAVAEGVAPKDTVAVAVPVPERVAVMDAVGERVDVGVLVSEDDAPGDRVAVGVREGITQRQMTRHELYAV